MKIKKFLFVITTMFLMVQGASAWNGSGSSGDPYQITSTADWNTLATSTDEYSDTFFKLTADITVTTMRTKTFKGTFDGGGHTLTFNYTATGDNAAPFAYITGATIKNLRVAGTITTSKQFAAGIVAISNGGSIENCRSSVTIDSSTSGDGTHGGLVADSYQGRLDINNCLFDGKLLGKNTTNCGGIVGWHKQGTLNITNTLFAPAEVTVQVQGGAIFARNGATITNCYYISDWAAATMQGTNAGSMTKPELVAALNNGDKHWCIHRSSAIPIMVNLVINNASEWNSFASNVSDYNDKYVKLNADISVTTIATGSFTGIFDGNGHTMTVNISPASGNEAAFRYLNNGTIMNLNVTGTVTAGSNYASGLVARTSGGDCLIDNCIVNTNVNGTGWAGGLVAHADNASKLTITNCIYGGTLTQSSGYVGGILGWYNKDKTLDLVMTNCLFKGDYTGNGQFHPIGVKKWEGIFKSINCTNCYYTKNPANIDDAEKRTFTDGTKVSELTIGTTGVSIASGSYATFQGTKYYYGTVTLGYNGPMATTNFSLDGTHLNDNSFTISTDNAAFDDGTATIKWDFPGRGTVGDPYQISSAAVWDFLADQVNGGTNYSGKYFQQTGDFTVSSKIIGYPTDDTHYVTFNGIYDGNGCTITASISKSDERYVAPFHCIADATIKNVIVTGSVTVSGSASIEHRRHPAGLVGVTDGTCILQNCRVSANVSGCDYMGGLIGHTQAANITITGCIYSGTLTASGTEYTGGFIGWSGDNGGKTYALSNNLFAGSYSGNGKFHPVGFLYNPGGNTRTVTNTYYMTGLRNVGDDDGNSLVKGLANKGKFARSITAGTYVTIHDLGDGTEYNVSGITAYGTGIKYNDVYYAGSSDAVSLTLSHTAAPGFSVRYTVTGGGSLTNPTTNTPTLTMPAANVTINAIYGYSMAVGASVWQAISTPVHDLGQDYVSINNVVGLTNSDYDLLRYNETAAKWENQKSGSGAAGFNTLEIGRGYIYRHTTNEPLVFTGLPNSDANLSVTLTATDAAGDLKGFNLVGNPYPHTLPFSRDHYSLRPDGIWESHTDGKGILAIGEAVLVYTASGETLTLSPMGIVTGGKGTLPPLPQGLCLNNENENQNDNSQVSTVNSQFAYQQGDHLVVTGEGMLQAFDIMGRQLFSKEINSQLSILNSQFPHAGVYILKLDNNSQKIVIK